MAGIRHRIFGLPCYLGTPCGRNRTLHSQTNSDGEQVILVPDLYSVPASQSFLRLATRYVRHWASRHYDTPTRPRIPTLEQQQINDIPLVVYVPALSEDDSDGVSEEHQDVSIALDPDSDTSSSSPIRIATGYNVRQSLTQVRSWSEYHVSSGHGSLGADEVDLSAAFVALAHTNGPEDLRFEPVEHPLVALDLNQAVCRICMIRFVEPKRRDGPIAVAETDHAPLKSSNNGNSPAEALRILACRHIFHVRPPPLLKHRLS